MTPEEEFNSAIWWTLQEIELARLFSEMKNLADEKNSDVFDFEIKDKSNAPQMDNQRRAVEFLEKREALNIVNRKYPMKMSPIGTEVYNLKPTGYALNILQPKFEELYKSYGDSAEIRKRAIVEIFFDETEQKDQPKQENIYKISVKDREIWVNDYIIGKPHAVGKNFELFDYANNHQGEQIKKSALPPILQAELKEKTFTKILYELGFKGEILKAFFQKRSKASFCFYAEVTIDDLQKKGVNIKKFLKELKISNLQNSPE